MKYKKYDLDNVKVFTIETNKCKNCYLEINFRDDIRNVDLSKRYLLAKALEYSSLKYPSKRKMMIALEELYNMSFSSSILRAGYNHYTNFAIDFLNPKYVKEKNYLHEVLSFLFDTLLYPNVSNNTFDEQTLQVLKEKAHVNLDSYKERPLSFARIDSLKRLFASQIPSKRLIGTHEEIDKVTNKDLYNEYQKMFQDASCEILVIGNMNMDEVVAKISELFYKTSNVSKEILFNISHDPFNFKEEIVPSTYNQTQLLIYYDLRNLTFFEKEYILPIFSRIFGSANMTDKLTTYLRIQNSLCYYCGFYTNKSDNYGMVYVGLKKDQIKKAKEMIFKAMKEMSEKQIDETYFEQQKEKYLADLKIREDDIYNLIDTYYSHEIMKNASLDELKEEIPKVTLNDIQALAKKMELAYIYILEEGEEL